MFHKLLSEKQYFYLPGHSPLMKYFSSHSKGNLANHFKLCLTDKGIVFVFQKQIEMKLNRLLTDCLFTIS